MEFFMAEQHSLIFWFTQENVWRCYSQVGMSPLSEVEMSPFAEAEGGRLERGRFGVERGGAGTA
jgi:hypothetical protein